MTARVARSGQTRAASWRREFVPIWRAPAAVACRGEDLELFYKPEGESAGARDARTEKAKALCAACRFRTECLEAAMAEEKNGGGRFGIRGGRTENERRDLQVSRTLKAKRAAERAARAAEGSGNRRLNPSQIQVLLIKSEGGPTGTALQANAGRNSRWQAVRSPG